MYKDHLFSNKAVPGKKSSTLPLINYDNRFHVDNIQMDMVESFANKHQKVVECGGGGNCGPLSLKKRIELKKLTIPKNYKGILV